MKRSQFNKELFSKLLQKAMGERKMSEYAHHAEISLTYLSELIREQRDNPPMPPTIKKLATKAYNGVTYEELMSAAGHLEKTATNTGLSTISRPQNNDYEFFMRAIGKLSPDGKKQVYDYIEWVDHQEKQKKKK